MSASTARHCIASRAIISSLNYLPSAQLESPPSPAPPLSPSRPPRRPLSHPAGPRPLHPNHAVRVALAQRLGARHPRAEPLGAREPPRPVHRAARRARQVGSALANEHVVVQARVGAHLERDARANAFVFVFVFVFVLVEGRAGESARVVRPRRRVARRRLRLRLRFDSDADASSSAPSRGRRKGPAAAAFDAAYSSLTTRHRHPTSPWSCAIARTIRTTVSTGSRERASDPATSAETASAATRSPPWCSPSHRTTTSSLRTCGATILRAARARHAKRAWLRSRAASEACVEANLGACFATSASAARSMSSSKRASRPAPLRRGSLRRRAKIPRRHHACSKRSSHARQRSGSQWCAARREAGDGDARTRAPRREDASMEDWEVAEERETRS